LSCGNAPAKWNLGASDGFVRYARDVFESEFLTAAGTSMATNRSAASGMERGSVGYAEISTYDEVECGSGMASPSSLRPSR
jgi:hypothetical protein